MLIPFIFSVSFDSNLAKDMCDSDDSDEELPVGLSPIQCGMYIHRAS